MCEEMAAAWQTVKTDDSVNAVVLRAAGHRAFSAGLDVKTPYGQPENIWNHEDPGEALSPKWQKMWKPVVCAVQGMCTAGAFYFVNESDVVICSSDATFFDSHVSAGLVCALEPIGLMRRVGLGETLRIALMGNDERVSADTALRIGLVSEVVVAGRPVDSRTRDRRDDRRPSAVGHPGHRQGDLGVAGQALPGGPGAGAHLHPARQSDRRTPRSAAARRPSGVATRRFDDGRTGSVGASPTCCVCIRTRRRGVRAAMVFLGAGRRPRRPGRRTDRRTNGRRSACCCATGRCTSRRCSRYYGRGATVVVINPARGDDRITSRYRRSSSCHWSSASPTIWRMLGELPGTATVSVSDLAAEPDVAAAGRERPVHGRPGVAVRMLTSGTTGPPKRIDLTYDMLAHSVMGPETDNARGANGAAARCCDRQLAAGAHRRRLPDPAMRRRGASVRSAGAVRARPVGRRGTHAPAPRGVAGAGRVADGAALRPDHARTWPASVRSRRAPPRCRPTMPTRSPRSTGSRF